MRLPIWRRLIGVILIAAGCAVWGFAAFVPMFSGADVTQSSLWDVLSVADLSPEDYEESAGAWTFLMTFGPIALVLSLAAIMLLGRRGTFRGACAAAIGGSVTWLASIAFILSWWRGIVTALSDPPDFNAVRWLLLLGPSLCLVSGVIGLATSRSDTAHRPTPEADGGPDRSVVRTKGSSGRGPSPPQSGDDV